MLIVGFFFGNDMMDAYYVARSRPHWHGWRVAAEAAAESTAFDRAGQAEPRKRFAALRNWLSRNSVFYSVLRDTLLRRFAMAEQDSLAQGTAPDVRLLWRDASPSQVRTIFTPRYRLAAVDMRNREVREGMQISQNALAALKASADRGAIRLLVVLIPTKERAYCRQLRSSGFNLPESYQQLCEAEAQASAALRHFLVEHDIGYVDVLPALEAHISRNLQLYPQDSDNHPQAAGYAVIARELEAAVRRLRSKN